MNHIRKYPPYGKRIGEMRRRNLAPARKVIIATDWSVGKLFPRIIVTPDMPITNLRFEYLAGLNVQIAHFDHDESILPELTNEILAIQPASLAAFNLDAAKRREPAFKMIFSQSVLVAA